jgi:NADH:ubiquinone oxidoreductase subunit 2 (subunit N)
LLLVSTIKALKINNIKQIPLLGMPALGKTCLLLTMLSLGGLPPFLGFYAKLYVIIIILNQTIISLLIVLLAGSLVSLFYYLKVSYNTLIAQSQALKLAPSLAPHKEIKTFVIITLGITILPLVVLLT